MLNLIRRTGYLRFGISYIFGVVGPSSLESVYLYFKYHGKYPFFINMFAFMFARVLYIYGGLPLDLSWDFPDRVPRDF